MVSQLGRVGFAAMGNSTDDDNDDAGDFPPGERLCHVAMDTTSDWRTDTNAMARSS